MLGVGFWVWNASGEVPVSTGCWAAPNWEAKPSSRDSAAVLGRAQIHPMGSKTLSLGNQESAKVPVRAGKEPRLEMGPALLSQPCWGSGASPATAAVLPVRGMGKGLLGFLMLWGIFICFFSGFHSFFLSFVCLVHEHIFPNFFAASEVAEALSSPLLILPNC